MDINELPCFFIVLNGLIDVMLEVNELLFHSTVAECRLCEISGHELVYEVFLPCKYSSLLAPSAALENVKLAVSKLKGEFSSVQTDEGIYWKTNMAF